VWISFLLFLQGGCIPVAGDRILAADLAPFAEPFRRLDGNAVIAYAPLPGLERRLTRREMRAAAGAGSEADLPDSLCVIRAAGPLEPDGIAAAMRASLPDDASLEILGASVWPVPAGRLEFPLSGLRRTAVPGRYRWKGRLVPHGGGPSVPVAVEIRLRLRRLVLVTRDRLEAGAELTEQALVLEERDVELPAPPVAPDPASFAGWRSRRSIEAGQPVSGRDLIPPAAARAGQTVTLIGEGESARVAVEARALTAGRVGDRVLVQSGWNGKRIEARLVGPGRAVAERIVK
jgi:flagella basal body P-ring formation protein FlgA